MNEPERTLSQGLFHILEPLAQQYEERIRAIQQSQVALSTHIDVLSKGFYVLIFSLFYH